MIDHTLLSFDADIDGIEKLCREATEQKTVAICVNPLWVSSAKRIRFDLGASFRIASVIDFPLGASTAESRASETASALKAGADEIDQVISVGLLKSGNILKTFELIVASVKEGGYQKVILEMSALTDSEKIDAALLARFAGADMLKTSTGVNGKATVEDVRILRMIAGNRLGVKAAGGIRDGEALQKMVEAGADRIGASSTQNILQQWS
ncbi:deoxyribose-phosphate aldolase [bacterium]|nr:deoxyribose-phosphate aldolase [bacterium]